MEASFPPCQVHVFVMAYHEYGVLGANVCACGVPNAIHVLKTCWAPYARM